MVIDRFCSYTNRLASKNLKTALIAASWDDSNDVMPYTEEQYPYEGSV
ncbi:MAG: hypothetical protein HUJ98_11370 [Bacteroidaceae bacterium]|nr:hypothetical protein [Blautia sp.]MCF0187075.1 hypothetical protein [Bacteroidaceae bacterium]